MLHPFRSRRRETSENVGRNKLAQFRHRGSPFAVGLPELRKLVRAYGPRGRSIRLNQQFRETSGAFKKSEFSVGKAEAGG